MLQTIRSSYLALARRWICSLFGLMVYMLPAYHYSQTDEAAAYEDLMNTWFEQNLDSALAYGKLAGAYYQRANQPEKWGEIINSVGTLYYIQGNIQEAETWVDSAWQIAQSHLSPKSSAYRAILSNQLAFKQINGEYQAVIAAYHELLQSDFIPQTKEEYNYLGNVHINLANAYLDLKSYSLAISHLKAGIRILKTGEVSGLQLIIPYLSLGNAFAKSMYPDSALTFFQTAAQYYTQYPAEDYKPYYAAALESLSSFYYFQQQYDSALHYLQQYQQIAPDQAVGVVPVDLLAASIYLKKGEIAEATSSITQAESERIRYFGPEGNRLLRSRILHTQGNILAAQGTLSLAESTFQEGLGVIQYQADTIQPLSYQTHFPYQAARIWGDWAGLLATQADTADLLTAGTYYRAAIRLFRQAVSNLRNQASRASMMQDLNWIYEGYLDLLWRLDSLNPQSVFRIQALQVMEESRTQLMRLSMQDSWDKVQAGIPDSLLKQELRLRQDLGNIRNLLHQELAKKSTDFTRVDSLEDELFTQEQALQTLVQSFQAQYPRYAALKYQPPSSLAIQNLSPADNQTSYWVSYWGAQSLYVYIGAGQNWKGYKIPIQEVSALADSLQRQLLQPSIESNALFRYQRTSYRLWQLLKLDQIPTSHRLVVIPDGRLYQLPFEALCIDTLTAPSWGQAAYLGTQLPIRYEYALLPLPEKPAIRQQERSWFGVAPVYEGLEVMQYNATEVSQVGAVMKGLYKAGPDATAAYFMEMAPSHHWLHFAGHARADARFPLQSHLLFSPSESRELYAWEIYNLDLGAAVIVLSGCETGAGRYQRGEGIQGLSQAFRYAGVPNIVQSLWLAEGKATQELMQRFYTQQATQPNLSTALLHSRQQFLQEMPVRYQHPFYWANFVLVGPDIEQESSYWYWVLGIAVLLTIVGGVWWIQKQPD